jgi:predicted glycoside hydrolase/deacetylase ChbG (UPF0249 family)
MKKLIVTADDFGYGRNVNKAIIKCFKDGIVTSTSLLANTKHFGESIGLLKKNRGLDVGLHLNLTEFRPLTRSKTLEKNGNFVKKEEWYNGHFKIADKGEIESEAEAQFKKAISSGLDITHVDGHNHIHVFPKIIDIAAKLARKYNVKWIRLPYEKAGIRPYKASPKKRLHSREQALSRIHLHGLAAPDNFFGGFFLRAANTKKLIDILNSLGDGVNELMVHPAYLDKSGDYFHKSGQRENEIRLLTSPKIKSFIKENKIMLTSFSKLK